MARVRALVGSLTAAVLFATVVPAVGDDGAPTPSPTPTETATVIAEPEVSTSPEPEATETPEPEATDTPEPEATESPEPVPSEDPVPVVGETSAPEAVADAPVLPAAVGCSVDLRSAGVKPVGEHSFLWGWATNCGPSVTVQTRTTADWATAGTATVGAGGYFTFLTPNATQHGLHLFRAGAEPTWSPEVRLERLPTLTAYSAGSKAVGENTFLWGSVSDPAATVVVQVQEGTQWRDVADGTPSATGSYAILLSHGSTEPGTYTFRAVTRTALGTEVASAPVGLARLRTVTAYSAGTKPVGQVTNTWGTVAGAPGVRVWTEVDLGGGRWSTSQISTTSQTGSFVIPLTYGATTPGTYRWRVAAQAPEGVVRSAVFTLTRTAIGFQSTITNTTSAEVSSTYRAGCPVGPSDLSTIRMSYRDYAGTIRTGEMIVRRDTATAVRDAFREAYDGGFRVAQMRNPNVWGGDDIKMMAANNSSAFNCRQVTGNPYRVSPHSYGRAVDVNPAENPYLAGGRWYPSATYSTYRPAGVIGMHYPDGAFVRAMERRGFEWFSGWDWHHFER